MLKTKIYPIAPVMVAPYTPDDRFIYARLSNSPGT